MGKWTCKKACSNFYSPITAYLLFLHAYNFGRILQTTHVDLSRSQFTVSLLYWHLVSPPTALHLTRQQETVSYVCCLQLFALKWNLAIMSSSIWWEILDFIHAGRAAPLEGKCSASKDIGRGPKPSRPPRRISQMFPLTGYPCVCNLQPRNIITFSSKDILSECGRNEK